MSGQRTRWDDFWDQHEKKAQPTPRSNGAPVAVRHGTAYATKALREELQILQATEQGKRNDQLNISGFKLAQLVAAGELDRDDTWTALYETGVGIGLTTTETTRTLRSAFNAGGLQPRVIRDLPLPEAPAVTVLNGTHAPAEEETSDELSLQQRFPALDWHELWEEEDEEEWIVEPLLPARRLVALFSPPKVGKSLLMLELAVAVARGEPILGYTPTEPRRVLYVDFENDPRGDVRSRLQAMGRSPDELGDLIYLSYPRLAYLDTWIGGQELLAVVEEYRCEVVVIDTISRAVGGEENENDTWLSFYRNTGLALKAAGKAVIRLDHTGKDLSKGMRGGSAKYGDVDAVWSMTTAGGDTLLLECTANRLLIEEKELVVKRETHPLRHKRLDGDSRTALGDARRSDLLAELHSLYRGQKPPKLRQVMQDLRAAGQGCRWQQMTEAVDEYLLDLGAPGGAS